MLYWVYNESKFEYEQSFQRASEIKLENHIFYINHDTNQENRIEKKYNGVIIVMFYDNIKQMQGKCSECLVV